VGKPIHTLPTGGTEWQRMRFVSDECAGALPAPRSPLRHAAQVGERAAAAVVARRRGNLRLTQPLNRLG
jgi:hypothetical protein